MPLLASYWHYILIKSHSNCWLVQAYDHYQWDHYLSRLVMALLPFLSPIYRRPESDSHVCEMIIALLACSIVIILCDTLAWPPLILARSRDEPMAVCRGPQKVVGPPPMRAATDCVTFSPICWSILPNSN